MTASAHDDHGACPAHALPPELLSSVFQWLTVNERLVAATACRRWARAAQEPPHSRELSLLIAGDVPEGDPRPLFEARFRSEASAGLKAALASGRESLERASKRMRTLLPAGSRDASARRLDAVLQLPACAREAVSAARAAAVLRGPASAGVVRLRLAVCSAHQPRPGFLPDSDCGLPAVLAACPPSLARLEIAAGGSDDAAKLAARCGLERLPAAAGLRELRLLGYGRDARLAVIDDPALVPRLPKLERFEACVGLVTGAELLRRLPGLRLVHKLKLMGEHISPSLAALAAAGVRCRCLTLVGIVPTPHDLAAPGAAARLAAVCRPPADAAAALEPPRLALNACKLPGPAAWPPGALAGLASIAVQSCDITREALAWIAGGAHAATLQRLEFGGACTHSAANDDPAAFLEALRRLPESVEVELRVPYDFDEHPMRPDALRGVLEGAAACPRLLRSLEVLVSARTVPADAAAAYGAYRAARAALVARPRSD